MHLGVVMLMMAWAAGVAIAILVTKPTRTNNWEGFAIGVLFSSIIPGIVLLITGLMAISCEAFADKSGVPTEYSWAVGCTADVAGRQIPTDLLRVNEFGEWVSDADR